MINLLYRRKRIVIETDLEILDAIRLHFTFENKSAKYQLGADPFWSPISPLGSFKTGLFSEVYKYIKSFYPDEELNIDKEIFNIAFPQFNNNTTLFEPVNKEYKYRDYQEAAIKQVIKSGRGIILMPTRSGKSMVMYGAALNIGFNKLLIIVPNIQLVKQMYKDFIDYGWDPKDITMFSGSSKNYTPDSRIIIANSQYILKHIKELPTPDVIFIDEIHTTYKPGSKISKCISSFKTLNKIGFTGTLPGNKMDEYKIKADIGSVIYERKVYEMQQAEILADVKIYPIRFVHKNKPKFQADSYEDLVKRYIWEVDTINANDISNIKIVSIAKKLPGNSLILFDRIEHGRKLYELLEYDNKCFVDGSVSLDKREDVRKKMSVKSGCITIANTKCFSTGITLKQIQNIIFAMSGKGVTKIIQSIGRGLERNKSHINLFDIFHNYHYSEKHFRERVKLYKQFYNISIMSSEIKQVNF